ncbi:MAG: hypothetical protein N2170_03580 [Bacteroidia bacterium]|nr:hypothetical protein [Bacteroidia bacterium]
MLSSGYSRRLEVPVHRGTSEYGLWLKAFLDQAVESLPESHCPAFLRQLFRWLLQIEGGEKLSEEELRVRRERFYFLLPEPLRTFYPWEEPQSLPAVKGTPPPYPQEHTPFRQYGFLATQWAEALLSVPENQRARIGQRLVWYLLQAARNQGHTVEEAVLLQHLSLLSGDRLHLEAQGIEPEQRGPVMRPDRRPSKGRRHFHRRR